MSIQKTNPISFSGIRKVVNNISQKDAKVIQKVFEKNDSLPFLLPVKKKLLSQIINFFNGKKQVGMIHKYEDGSFLGIRTFADGTRVIYGANKVLTKTFGEVISSNATVTGKGILSSTLPYKPFDKKGNIIIPSLKEIKAYNKPENIIKLIKEGKLQVIKALTIKETSFRPMLHDGFVRRI